MRQKVPIYISDLRVAAIGVTVFHAFLRFSELASLRCCDVQFMSTGCDIRFVELFIGDLTIYRTATRWQRRENTYDTA